MGSILPGILSARGLVGQGPFAALPTPAITTSPLFFVKVGVWQAVPI